MKHINLLKTIPFFTGLSNDELEYFVSKLQQKEYKKNRQMFHYGEPADKFFIILEGWVKLYRVNKDGDETVISLVTIGDAFSEAATFEGSDYPYSTQVVGGGAKVLLLEACAIREEVRKNPNIALKMLASISHHNNQLSLTYEHISKLTASQRVGCFLLKLSMDREYKTNLQLPYNKYLVASRLGMKPETFSRAMKRLNEDLNINFQGREITIPDIDLLQEYCEVECFNEDSCSLEKRLLCTNKQCDIYRILKLM
ncbi:MAG: Crp/Fnr family transcriptional regulator [Rickettsiales bacterium]|nr:Crp/Fnr family transcriptional regulator [Pseudomonadota bacterium]MDA0967595.1 Crp/Fnr family transcriptional regulator [Pseudomonadota bacterium]MDG4544376.1 Crp/Fnr family transcriptional regulator [Rickettsiales bacterium]MDG4546506.1 Crp/Fnr family transcriptional regulator [Rickettsiales bacterium]MDG4548658.1 Crp/Fnr family transcriptional regulator [Rickettsiales bacterium]